MKPVQLSLRLLSTGEKMADSVYQIIESKTEALLAIDQVIASAAHRLSIFDEDPVHLREHGFGAPSRIAALRQYLLGNRQRQLVLVLHEVRAIESEVPRLVALVGHFSSQFAVRRTVGRAREAHDPMVLADRHSIWHHLHIGHPRSVLSMNDPEDCQPRAERFEDILESSEAVSVGSTAGL